MKLVTTIGSLMIILSVSAANAQIVPVRNSDGSTGTAHVDISSPTFGGGDASDREYNTGRPDRYEPPARDYQADRRERENREREQDLRDARNNDYYRDHDRYDRHNRHDRSRRIRH